MEEIIYKEIFVRGMVIYNKHVSPDGTLDQELPIARVNYMLRAAVIPAGAHTLAMVFDPACMHKGNALSLGCFALFLLLLAGAVMMDIRCCKQARKATLSNQ